MQHGVIQHLSLWQTDIEGYVSFYWGKTDAWFEEVDSKFLSMPVDPL